MQNTSKHPVSGQELDNLLKQAFLDLDVNNPKHTDLMETVANHTLNTPVPPAGTTSSFFSLKWILAYAGIFSLIVIASFFLITHEEEEADVVKTIGVPPPIVPGQGVATVVQYNDSLPKEHITIVPEKSGTIISGSNFVAEPKPVPPKEKSLPAVTTVDTKVQPKDTGYVFPVLTDEEIKANEKRKLKMLTQAIKLSSAKYVFIPQAYIKSDYFYSKGVFMQQYMQSTEVSNIEYKTFLFDLLIRGDRAGFLKAKPKQTLWSTIYDKDLGKYFEDMYFSDKVYNNHPVVNVSREGAELYCKWLKEEAWLLADEKDMVKEEERDLMFNRSYGLPRAKDWAYAAEAGKLKNAYPWDGTFMRNSKGVYLANFCIEKETPGTSAAGHYTSAEVGLGEGQVALMCRVDGFKANAFDLYNMSGNAAEFVLDDSTGQLLTKGGSWNSGPEALKISSAETVTGNGASPYNGFRPVINVQIFVSAFAYRDPGVTYDRYGFSAMVQDTIFIKPIVVKPIVVKPIVVKPIEVKPIVVNRYATAITSRDTGFAFPKFTARELAEGKAVKEKMIKALSAFSKDKYAFVPMGSCFYGTEMVSAAAFYMQNTEVSNAEYRAFLTDLYLKGERDEFRKCLPDQALWASKFPDGYNDPMKHLYFAHAAYDDYPVVNVSKYGAEAYCTWLSLETNKQQAAQGKALINDVRLPSDAEWALAASNKKNKVTYANGTDSLKTNKGKYMQNYSCRSFKDAYRDSVRDLYAFKERKTEDPVFIADGGFHTCYVRMYEPNLYGIYNLAGNVSEMVYLWDTATNKAKGFGTKGGSWFSTDHFLEVNAEQEFMHPEKASPFTGFRPVITAAVK